MNSEILDVALKEMRFSIYRTLFNKEGIEIEEDWLREQVFSGASDSAIQETVDEEVKQLTRRRGLNYWAYRGIRSFRRGLAVRRVE